MKRSSNGGSITLNGVVVAYILSWSFDEGEPVVFGTQNRITGNLDVIFDESTNHAIKTHSIVDIAITPSVNSSSYLIKSASIMNRSVSGAVDQILKASIQFQADGEVVYS